jgi:7-cyano-7-deazaguanine synthase
MREKSVVCFSGGMDSATVLAAAIEETTVVQAVSFRYGSKHNQYENQAAEAIAKHYNVPWHLIDLSEALAGCLESNLLKSGGAIPEGHYQASNMSQTVVPGRNMIFASILAGVAWSKEASLVWMGIHSGDHVIYPDCRPEFYHHMNKAIMAGTDNKVGLIAPFLHGNKETILQFGIPRNVPYHLTRTCYKDQPIACGVCGACQERKEAFKNLGLTDPIQYEVP